MQRLDDGIIKLKRGAIATKDAKGNLMIRDSKYVGSAWGLLGGGLIGALLGAMLGPVAAAAGAAANVVASATAAGAAEGAVGGGAMGSLVDLTDLGLNESFIDEVTTQIYPGDTALIAELSEGSTVPIDRIVSRYGARIYRSELA